MTTQTRFVVSFPVSSERQVEVRADWPLSPAEWNRMWTLLEDMRVDLVEQFTWEPPTSPPVGTVVVDMETAEKLANDAASGLPTPLPVEVEPEPEPEAEDGLEAAVSAPKRTTRRRQKQTDES